jgi:predicted P-loop ATPase
VTVKRHTVFCGTANPTDILRDPTGNRRYWPVIAKGEVDLKKLAAWRDQLWAEAVVAYDSGEAWWFQDAADVALVVETQGAFMKADGWEVPVLDWVEKHYQTVELNRAMTSSKPLRPTGEFDVGTVLKEALNILTERQDAKAQSRVKAILVGAGYPDVRPATRKGTPRRTYYVRKDLVEEFKENFSMQQRETAKPPQEPPAADFNA